MLLRCRLSAAAVCEVAAAVCEEAAAVCKLAAVCEAAAVCEETVRSARMWRRFRRKRWGW